MALGDLGDRCEILERVIVAEAVDSGADNQRARISEQERVAVRVRVGDEFRSKRAAGAAAVFDDYRLAKEW